MSAPCWASTYSTTSDRIPSLIIKAAYFASMKHRTQKRKDAAQTPFINHPIGVAYILTEEGNVSDVDVIQAALLHDTIEDTDTTFEELEEVFGKRVRDLVAEVTDDKTLPGTERKRLQIVHAPSTSPQAKLIKLADKLYNCRNIEREFPVGWSEERALQYFIWSKKVIDGLRGINKKLEDKLDEVFERNIA